MRDIAGTGWKGLIVVMTSLKMKSIRVGLVLLAGGSLSGAVPVLAQSLPYGASQYREDPGVALSRNLKALGDSPRSLTALMGAGKAALELGDPQAAVTFFARAEEIAPRDGRIKAGFGSAFLMMEQPGPAMKFFSEASGLGVSDAELARDRGLAYDLLGDPKRAQADYALALRRGEDPEVRRRLALSLANSGDRNGALAAIDGQLRQQDRAAWRTRAFVLALAGDTAEAAKTMQSVMPGQVAAMQPFFARLPSLNPSQRAMAVHYGHFPSDARPVQMAQAPTVTSTPPAYAPTPAPIPPAYVPRPTPAPAATPRPAPVATARVTALPPTAAGRPDSGQFALGRPRTSQPPAEQRRAETFEVEQRAGSLIRSVRRTPTPTPAAPRHQPVRTSPTTPAQAQLPRTAPVQAPVSQSSQQPSAAPASPNPGFAGAATGSSAPFTIKPRATPAPTVSTGSGQQLALNRAPQVQGAPGTTNAALPVAQVQASVASTLSMTPQAPSAPLSSSPTAATPAPKPAAGGLAAVAAAVNALSDPTPAKPAPAPAAKPKLARADVKPPVKSAADQDAKLPAAKKPKDAADKDSKAAADKKAKLSGADAGRYWVQIASAPDRLVASEFKRLKAKAPKLLADKSGWSSPLGGTNRVLVGPFKSAGEAQELVNQLAKADLAAFSWTSPAGQEIAKLAAR